MSKLSEQVDDMETALVEIWQDKEQLIRENTLSNQEYSELRKLYIEVKEQRDSAYLNRDIAEDKTKELKAERDMLAYENKNLAGFIKYNNSTLTDIDVGDIATSGFTGDIWERFTDTEASQYLLSNNIEQRETIRKLRRKLTKIENICNDTNEEE